MCRAHATVRGILAGLVAGTRRVAVVDLEAGLEHLSRGTARHVDTMLVVAEPYFKSLETARRTFALAGDLGVPAVHLVANKVRTPAEEGAIRDFAGRHALPLLAVVPWDDAVVEADRRGDPPATGDRVSPAVRAVAAIADRLRERAR
jgi:CO dehydrogenase maturation factor